MRLGLVIGLMLVPVAAKASAQPDYVPENSEGWAVKSAWVTVLDREEQTVVILLLRSQLNDDLIGRVAPNAKKSPRDLEWMIKTQFVANDMLARLATKSPAIRAPLEKCRNELALVIEGKMTLANYQATSAKTTQAFAGVFASIDLEKGANTQRKYKRRIDETATHLIGLAKLIASEGPKSKLR
jgi:hypothetical protein